MSLELWALAVGAYFVAGAIVSIIWKLTAGWEDVDSGGDSKAWLVGIDFLLWPLLAIALVLGGAYVSVEALGKLLIRLKIGGGMR